jgi:hypothetical protein
VQIIKQSDPRAAERRVYFLCVDTAALQTRLQSSDMSTFTVKISKNGADAVAPAAGAPVQVDATDEKGVFYLELTTGDIDTAGTIVLKISNTGGTKTMEPREITVKIAQAYFATVVVGTSTTSFTTDRTETDNDYWRDCFAAVLTGALAGQVKKIGGYTGSSKLVSLVSPLTNTLGVGDIVELIDR